MANQGEPPNERVTLVDFVRTLAFRLEVRESQAFAERSAGREQEQRTIAGSRASVYGELREDLLMLLDVMEGRPARSPRVPRSSTRETEGDRLYGAAVLALQYLDRELLQTRPDGRVARARLGELGKALGALAIHSQRLEGLLGVPGARG